MSASQPVAPTPPGTVVAAGGGPRGSARNPFKTIFTVAWLSILLGLAVEALLLIAAVAFGTAKSPKPFIADLAQKASWSVLVCIGLGFGTLVTKAKPQAMGLLGILAAPVAFGIARSLHKGAAAALGLAAAGGGLPPIPLAIAKAVQYGLLGWMLGRLEKRPGAGLGTYALAGLATGLVFGGSILFATFHATPGGIAPAGLVARGISEILFPVGCAAVLYVATTLGGKSGK